MLERRVSGKAATCLRGRAGGPADGRCSATFRRSHERCETVSQHVPPMPSSRQRGGARSPAARRASQIPGRRLSGVGANEVAVTQRRRGRRDARSIARSNVAVPTTALFEERSSASGVEGASGFGAVTNVEQRRSVRCDFDLATRKKTPGISNSRTPVCDAHHGSTGSRRRIQCNEPGESAGDGKNLSKQRPSRQGSRGPGGAVFPKAGTGTVCGQRRSIEGSVLSLKFGLQRVALHGTVRGFLSGARNPRCSR